MTHFRYVRHTDLLHRLAQGYIPASDLGHSHGEYSSLMQWAGEGDAP